MVSSLFALALFLKWQQKLPADYQLELRAPSSTHLVPAFKPSQQTPAICTNIYDLVCQKLDQDLDPTGTVRSDEEGEKRAREIYGNIISDHEDWSTDQVDEEFVQRVFNSQNRARIETAFFWVKRTLIQWIDHLPNTVFTPEERIQIEDRIHRVELQLPPPAKLYQDEPDLLTKSELLYERKMNGDMALRVGGAYVLITNSWFNAVFSIAHELGHAIDPCEIRSAGLSFPAYDRLVGCFLERKLVALKNTREECRGNDQLSEIFADWIAVQVTAQALNAYSTHNHSTQHLYHAARNSVRDLCSSEIEEDRTTDSEFHPSAQIRIEEVFGRNPQIRHFLGCDTAPVASSYCTFERESK